jgi:hypothetical protein
MTRKEYLLLAAVLRETAEEMEKSWQEGDSWRKAWMDMTNRLIDVLWKDNPRFRRETFWRAIEKGGKQDEIS